MSKLKLVTLSDFFLLRLTIHRINIKPIRLN